MKPILLGLLVLAYFSIEIDPQGDARGKISPGRRVENSSGVIGLTSPDSTPGQDVPLATFFLATQFEEEEEESEGDPALPIWPEAGRSTGFARPRPFSRSTLSRDDNRVGTDQYRVIRC